MERITLADEQGNFGLKDLPWNDIGVGKVITNSMHETLYEVISKLREYEDTGLTPEQIYAMDEEYSELAAELGKYKKLEEQGLLLKLPCKVGNMVYEIKKDLNSMKRETIEHNGHYYHRNIDVYFICQVMFEIEDISQLGKTIFLTKEEAEKALAGIGV